MCGSTRTLQYLNLGRQPHPDGTMRPLALQACLNCRVSHATHTDRALPEITLNTPIVVGDVSWLLSTLAFEHVSHTNSMWWSATSLREHARAKQVTLRAVERGGGELSAVFTRDASPSDSMTHHLVTEHHDLTRSAYMRFSDRVTQRMADLNRRLSAFRGAYVGVGATPMTTTLLHCMSVESYPSVVYDVFQGGDRVVPGTHIPVEPAPDWRTVVAPIVVFPGTDRAVTARIRASGTRAEIVSL